MAQAKLISVKKGSAQVIIKTNPSDSLPRFELDMSFTKDNAFKIMTYALQLKAEESV